MLCWMCDIQFRKHDNRVKCVQQDSNPQPSAYQQHSLLTNIPRLRQQVTAERMFLIADALEPLTMYEVSVTAHNAAGSSLTSGRVRAVTWVEETRNRDVSLPPGLPDVRQCCEDSGVTEPR